MKKLAWILLPTGLSVLALVALFFMASSGGRQPAGGDKPGGAGDAAVAIPDSQFREMIGNSKTRPQAAVQAGVQRMKSAVPLLKQYAVSDQDPEVRAACVRSMGQIGEPEAALALVTAGEDADKTVRLAAVEALGLVFDPACEKELIRQLRKEDPEIRRTAAKALAGFRGEEASSALARCLSDTDEPTRAAAVTELGQRKDPQAREGLARALGDASAAVRELASRALAREAAGTDWHALARATLDGEKAVREPAIEAARKVGEPMVPQIEKALTEGPATARNPSGTALPAREDAARLLMALGGVETVPALVRCLDKIPFNKEPPKAAVALRSAIVDYIAAMGERALEALARGGIEARADLFAKEAVAQICVKLGKPAAKPIGAYLLKRALFPNALELKLWVKTLGELGDPGSAAALNRALAQDVPGIGELVEAARKRIESKSGAKLPPAAPDAGAAASVKAIEIKRGLPADHAAAPHVKPGALPDTAVITLSLKNALIRPDNLESKKDLTIELTRNGGRWEREASGSARSYNQSFHAGSMTPIDDKRLRVEMAVGDDPWVSGGFGEYEITLEAGAEGLTGRYQGKYNYRNVSGAVEVECFSPPARYESVPMVESGEHPRLIFRKGEIPAMRQRAKTEVGAAIVRTIRDRVEGRGGSVSTETGADGAIGCGFLYALYGDEAMGRRAVPAIIHSARNPRGGHAHDMAYKLIDAALAYDFVYDCLTAEERTELTNYLASNVGIVTQTTGLTGNFNNGPNSNWTAIGLGGAGLAALATLREKGPPSLVQPLEVPPAFEFAAEAGAAPAAGTPLNEYKGGAILTQWLIAGPIDGAGAADLLGPLGGPEKARPTAETSITFQGNTVRFVPLPPAAVKEVPGFGKKPHKLALPATTAKSRSLLYALLKVNQEEGTRVEIDFPFGFEGAALWIDGRPAPSGSTAIFKPGIYRLLLDVRGAVVCPIVYKTDAHMQVGLYRRYLVQKEHFDKRRKRHEETGERQDVPIKLDIAKRAMVNWWRFSIGDHGWGTESGYAHAHACLMPFTVSYEVATGERVIPGTGIPWLCPLTAATRTESGTPQLSAVKGAPLGEVLHVIAPEALPAMLMPFQGEAREKTLKGMGCKELAYLFANYPFDAKPQPAEQVMPKAIEDRRKGGFVFRRSYDQGADDIVAVLFLRSEKSQGPCYFYCESGTFRIAGLGTPWAIGLPGDKRNWQYAQECVVLAPPNNGAGLAKKLYAEFKPDGSGVVGADMSNVYRDLAGGAKATRHFAVDYSGACGAPALVAVVDRIEGGENKVWLMHTEGAATAVRDNTFTITGKLPGTSLTGVFATADDVKLYNGPVVWNMYNRQGIQASKSRPKTYMDVDVKPEDVPDYVDKPWGTDATVKAVCGKPAAEYFVVMTIQKGPAPKIEVEGRGIGAKVRVGKRTVRYDREKERLILD